MKLSFLNALTQEQSAEMLAYCEKPYSYHSESWRYEQSSKNISPTHSLTFCCLLSYF